MNKVLQSARRIKFSDCDPMGHLYNAKYIQYLLDAREDQVEAAFGFNPIDYVKKTGQGWVVVQNQIAYIRPGIFNETIICQSFVRDYSSRLLEIECTMWNAAYSETKSVLWTRFVYMDTKTNRAANHPEDIMKLFEQAHVVLDQKSFEERVAYYRSNNK